MKLLILSLNYWPEPTGFAPHTTALAEHMAASGHDVSVVTGFPFAPEWRRRDDDRGQRIRVEIINGVRLVRVSHFIPRRPGSAWQRITMEGTFSATALAGGFFHATHPDLIVYVGAQPAIALLARAMATAWRIPYIVKITDLATQAALDVGVVKARAVVRLLESIEYFAYRRAAAAIVLCEPFTAALRQHGFGGPSHLIRDSVDLNEIRPMRQSAFRSRLGIGPDDFVVMHSGSLGLKQGLSDVVSAAEQLKARHPHIRWVIVGDGESRAALADRIRAAALDDRVQLLPLQPHAAVNDMLNGADLLLLSQLRAVKETVIPSKLLMYMAAGRPIVAAVNAASQAAALVRAADCGRVVEPESPCVLADAVADIASATAARRMWGANGRAYAERHFDRSAILLAQQRVIEDAASRQPIGHEATTTTA